MEGGPRQGGLLRQEALRCKRPMDEMAQEMDEVSEMIERFNDGEIDLYEDELFELMQRREKLLKDYYKSSFPENVIPLIPQA